MKTITILIKTVYGTEMAYPDCDEARLFSQLTGKKTLNAQDLAIIEKLGFIIEFKHSVINMNQLKRG